MCVTVCGKFVPDEGVVAGYGNRIRDKSPAKWGVQIAGMILGVRSNICLTNQFAYKYALYDGSSIVFLSTQAGSILKFFLIFTLFFGAVAKRAV